MTQELMLKYRPKTFKEFLGNKIAVESILGNLGTVHKYLFHGERGCGKTTLARLIGSELRVSGFDQYEIDAADNRGIADARKLKQSVPMMPMKGENKLYIIDEVHRLTGEAFDSLLKTLEEPPPHVYFCLCTTNIQKVPKTIRSRCKAGEFQVSPLTTRVMGELLDWVIDKEGLDVSDEVAKAVIKGAQGIPREALGLLEKVGGLSGEDAVELCLSGTVDDREVKELMKELLKRKPSWDEIRAILKGITEDVEKVRHGIMGYMTAVMLNSGEPYRIACILEEFTEPFYDSGKAGLSLACYLAIGEGKRK